MDPRDIDAARTVLRHLVATLNYRAAKVLRETPSNFGSRTFGSSTRQPVLIVAHLADLMSWAARMAQGDASWKAEGSDDWDAEVARFFDRLAALDGALASNESLRGPLEHPVEKLIQGPLADALTHVGQLAMLRGMAGVPIRPESYARAEIVAGRIGMEQAAARAEFDGDASVRS